MALRLRLTRTGNLNAHMRAEQFAMARGGTRAVTRTTEDLKRAFRGEVRSRLKGGNRIAGLVRSRLFKEPGGLVTGFVFSKWKRFRATSGTEDVLAFHETGGTIVPRRARRLLILFNKRDRRRGFRLAVSLNKNLAFVPQEGGRFLIVRRTRSRSTIIGILLRRVTIRPSLNFDRFRNRLTTQLAARLVVETERAARGRA